MVEFPIDIPASMRQFREKLNRVPSPREAFEMFARPERVPVARKEQLFVESAERSVLTESGDEIAVYAWGSGPVVALVHGWGGRAVNMCSFIDPLLRQGFRVVAFDGPGHGDSTGSICNVVRMSKCLVAIAEKEGELHAAIGHSFGAGGITVALRDGLNLRRVVQVAPLVNMVERFRQWATAVGLSAEGFKELMAQCDQRYGRGMVEAASGDRIATRLSVPALVLHDPDDDEVPFAGAIKLVEEWKGALLEEVPKLGHYRIVRSNLVVDRAVQFVAEA